MTHYCFRPISSCRSCRSGTQPEVLVEIAPFRGYDPLPQVLAANHLPVELLDDRRLKFLPEDRNAIPHSNDHFDAVVS